MLIDLDSAFDLNYQDVSQVDSKSHVHKCCTIELTFSKVPDFRKNRWFQVGCLLTRFQIWCLGWGGFDSTDCAQDDRNNTLCFPVYGCQRTRILPFVDFPSPSLERVDSVRPSKLFQEWTHPPDPPSNILRMCRICFATLKMAAKVLTFLLRIFQWIPVIFINSVIVWSYYAYVFVLCLGRVTLSVYDSSDTKKNRLAHDHSTFFRPSCHYLYRDCSNFSFPSRKRGIKDWERYFFLSRLTFCL